MRVSGLTVAVWATIALQMVHVKEDAQLSAQARRGVRGFASKDLELSSDQHSEEWGVKGHQTWDHCQSRHAPRWDCICHTGFARFYQLANVCT